MISISVWLFVLLIVFSVIGLIFVGLLIFTLVELIIDAVSYDRYLDEKYGGNENGEING